MKRKKRMKSLTEQLMDIFIDVAYGSKVEIYKARRHMRKMKRTYDTMALVRLINNTGVFEYTCPNGKDGFLDVVDVLTPLGQLRKELRRMVGVMRPIRYHAYV
jgi:hypothetical protein